MKQTAMLLAVCTIVFQLHAGVLGTVNLTDYDSFKHDTKGNTVASMYTRENQQITSCTLSMFDKTGTKKIDVTFPEAVGKPNCIVRACDGTWALLQMGDTYYSVVLSTSGVTILGTAANTVFQFRFMAGKLLLSYIGNTDSCQVFDRRLSSVGAPVTVLGAPHSLNQGKYFYCEGNDRTQIWAVKNELIKLIDETGEFAEIYEPGRLCCIQDDDLHKICKY
ncbi:MAG: hypothetical protein N2595_00350 [bacterium]|nr:hypothetical protein [bacterium]